MSKEKLINAIGEIDDKYINEAEEYSVKKKSKIKYAFVSSIAAVLCVAVGVSVFTVVNSGSSTICPPLYQYTPDTTNPPQIEYGHDYYQLIEWKDRTEAQKYNMLNLNNNDYDCYAKEISESYVGKSLGKQTLNGYDELNEKEYSKEAEVFEIKSINPDAALCVKHSDDKYYAYTNSLYYPDTLGSFMDDLKLYDGIKIRNIEYTIRDENNYFQTYLYEDIESKSVLDIIFEDRDINAEPAEYELPYSMVELCIAVDIPSIGCYNHAIELRADGCLTTNIMETRKTFNIGEKAVQKLKDYITSNDSHPTLMYDSSDEINSANSTAE